MIELRDFHVRYRGAAEEALAGIDLNVNRGEAVLITGPTGCGKTTLLRALAGLLHREGTAQFEGFAEVNGMPVERVNRSEFAPRVGILFQNPDDQITGFTPREEVAFGLENLGFDRDEIESRTRDALDEAGLLNRIDQEVEALSGGQKQRLATAAVMAMRPDVLLLDEPISNLDWPGRAQLARLLRHMTERGMTIVICSHETDEIAGLCDRLLRMENGKMTGAFEQSADKPDDGSEWRIGKENVQSDVVAELRGCRIDFPGIEYPIGPFDLFFRAGEITALFGPNGGGKTTLLNMLAGIIKPDAGRVFFDGRRIGRFDHRLLRRTGYVGQNPDLMLHHSTVEREVSARSRYLKLNGDCAETVRESLRIFNLDDLKQRHPFSLSQGQRQRCALAAATTGGCSLLVIDEPTTGQDRRQIKSIQSQLTRFAQQGASIVFSTHNVAAAQGCADRAILLNEGEIIFDGPIGGLMRRRELLRECGYQRSPAGGIHHD